MIRKIPYGKQWIEDDDIDHVVEVLKSDYLTTGPKIEEFEQEICNVTGAKYAVAISNGTSALHAACFAAGITEGDEVITTPMTFAATANAVLYCGGTPVFVDIDPITYNIDPKKIEDKITEKTKAIIPVHYTGQPADMDSIMGLAKKHNLIVIEDGAHAFGGKYRNKNIGTIGDMTTFSFHPVKPITTGEGGAIVTNNEQLANKMKVFRTHGITRDLNDINNYEGSWYYEQQFLGFNYRMTDIQAALGISQLKKIHKFLEKRTEIAEKYSNEFKNLDGIIIPRQLKETISGWHIYVIQLELEKLDTNRKVIFDELRKRGILVNVHYIPVYYHPYYQKLGYKKGICSEAEKLYERIITIPIYPKMEMNDVDYVISNVKEVIYKYKK